MTLAPAPPARRVCASQEDPEGAEELKLPSKMHDEFRPFVRKVPEFKFWSVASSPPPLSACPPPTAPSSWDGMRVRVCPLEAVGLRGTRVCVSGVCVCRVPSHPCVAGVRPSVCVCVCVCVCAV